MKLIPTAAATGPGEDLMRGEHVTGMNRHPWPQHYEISIRGRLGETIRSAFPSALQAEEHGDRTVLTIMADQAALYGVLAEAEALGLELLEVRPLPARVPQEPSS